MGFTLCTQCKILFLCYALTSFGVFYSSHPTPDVCVWSKCIAVSIACSRYATFAKMRTLPTGVCVYLQLTTILEPSTLESSCEPDRLHPFRITSERIHKSIHQWWHPQSNLHHLTSQISPWRSIGFTGRSIVMKWIVTFIQLQWKVTDSIKSIH